jgi:preprotein translocase subunit Sss1
MYPAFATGEELKKYKPEYVNEAKKSWIKVSRAWKNLGGDPNKLKQAIITGRNKKAHKEPEIEEYSNVVDPATASIIGAALGVVGALIGLLNTQLSKSGVSKNPYLDGYAPTDFKDELDSGELDYEPDENEPILDADGNWIDPQTGRRVDPKSGENLIMGVRSSYFWIGVSTLAVVAVIGIVLVTKKNKGK